MSTNKMNLLSLFLSLFLTLNPTSAQLRRKLPKIEQIVRNAFGQKIQQSQVGGPWYDVELGRLDGLSSTAASVEGMLPQPTENVSKLASHFAKNGLSLDDMIALSELCPKDLDPHKEIFMDPTTPGKFDNQGRGLFKSDQALFTDPRSKPTVNLWDGNGQLYNQAFVNSMNKLGPLDVKTGRDGNIRSNCETFN
ncbi:hypothetical protein BRARA_A00132 [Brassica rapa]|uniref:peroxidase n=1 Tax=Brassica campestris TaxID=3711 RepID=A0A398AKG3_BRACM|nr:hypothetical protein BRARA_A00132 [Brassica rapa]